MEFDAPATANSSSREDTQEYKKKYIVFPDAHRHLYLSALKTDYLFKKSPVFEVIK